MRVLVTGSEGKIGRELRKLLTSHDVLCVDKKTGADLRDFNTLLSIVQFNPEIVFHLAAGFERTVESRAFFSENAHDNIEASQKLNFVLQSCAALKCFVFASSYLVYNYIHYSTKPFNLHGHEELKSIDLHEESEVKPRNLCGASKLYTEVESKFVLDKFHPNARWVSARIFRVYGPGGEEVISRWVEAKKRSETICVFNPCNAFDFIHARDVATALHALAFSDVQGIYNVGTGEPSSIQEVLDIINPDPTKVFYDADKPQFNEFSCADTKKISDIWRPTITLEQGIREMLDG